jgi:hypothetical protein
MQPDGTRVRPGQHDVAHTKMGVILTATAYDGGALPGVDSHHGVVPVTVESGGGATTSDPDGGMGPRLQRRPQGILPLLIAHAEAETKDVWLFVFNYLLTHWGTAVCQRPRRCERWHE